MSGFVPRNIASLGMLATLGCGPAEIATDGPDMASLVEAYRKPTGAFHPGNVNIVSTRLSKERRELARFAGTSLLPDLLRRAHEGRRATTPERTRGHPDSRGLDLFTRELDGEAVLEVTQRCMERSGEVAGQVELTVGMTESGFAATATMAFERCRARPDKLFAELELKSHVRDPVTLDGEMRVHLGEELGFERLRQRDYLASYRGLLSDDSGVESYVAHDFRINLAERSLEIRVGVDGGRHVLVRFVGRRLRVRAINGNFACDSDTRSCVHEGAPSKDEP